MRNSFFQVFIYSFSLLLIVGCSSTRLQDKNVPGWLIPSKRNLQYPAEKYYVDFEERSATKKTELSVKGTLQKELEELLINQICSKVSSSIASSAFQTETDKINFVSSTIKETSRSSEAILVGKQEEFYFDKKNEKLYGFIYVKKDNLINAYKNSISLKINLLDSKIRQYNDIENVDGYSLLSQFNAEIKAIELMLEVYSIILGSRQDDTITEAFKELYGNFALFNGRFKDNAALIDRIINEADDMYRKRSDFDKIIERLNYALTYGPTNIKVQDKIAFYKGQWIDKLLSELTKYRANQEYLSAIAVADKLAAVDQKNAQTHRLQKEEIIKDYFNSTITTISRLLDSGSLTEGISQLEQIEDYAYVDARKYNALKARVDSIGAGNAVREIENLIYEKSYDYAQKVCRDNLRRYPKNRQLLSLQDIILEKITLRKKREMLNKRATRYIFEFNYSISHLPEVMYSPDLADNEQFDFKRINFNQKMNYFQGGLYRKIFIRENEYGTPDKPKFSYSQIGVRAGYLDLSNYQYQGENGNFNFKDSKLTQLELSFIYGRFFMFNVGYLNQVAPQVNLDSTISSVKEDYWCTTMGIRIPISFIHLTADATAFTNDYKTISVFTKLGVSLNIGFSKRFNQDDKKYLENEVSRLRTD